MSRCLVRTRALVAGLLAAGAAGAAGCFVHDRPGSGPPPHAPAHGHRAAAHVWVYYPDSAVYFCDPHRHYWTVDAGGTWMAVEALPPTLVLGAAVRLDLDAAEPWRFHGDHRRVYPPGHAKKAAAGPAPAKDAGPKGSPPGRGGPKPKMKERRRP